MSWSLMLICATLLTTPAQPTPSHDVNVVAEAALAKLPGHTGFLFTEIVDGKPQTLNAIRADERFAVGSSFKLFILGALADEVNNDRRGLGNIMRLEKQFVGPPHSELADWPLGSPVTLQTLALKMISISDNTATDHLLHLLGRTRVEDQMKVMGDAHPEWNIPLLSTREMTMLRDKNDGTPAVEYQKLDVAGKRKFLAEKLSGQPDYDKLDFDTAGYNLAEWYATPLDMAAAMTWLKLNTTEDDPAHAIRGVMAVETKLPPNPEEWP